MRMGVTKALTNHWPIGKIEKSRLTAGTSKPNKQNSAMRWFGESWVVDRRSWLMPMAAPMMSRRNPKSSMPDSMDERSSFRKRLPNSCVTRATESMILAATEISPKIGVWAWKSMCVARLARAMKNPSASTLSTPAVHENRQTKGCVMDECLCRARTSFTLSKALKTTTAKTTARTRIMNLLCWKLLLLEMLSHRSYVHLEVLKSEVLEVWLDARETM